MNDDLQAFALKSTVEEIKKNCPDVSNAFIFKNNKTIIAKDENTEEETVTHAINTLEAVAKVSDTIGGLESAIFYSTNNRLNVFKVDDCYVALVGSEEPDGENSASLARILVPTVLRLTAKISELQTENSRTQPHAFSKNVALDVEEPGTHLEAEEIKILDEENQKQQSETEQVFENLPEPLVTQLMVENLGRFHATSNLVRIDRAVIQQWKDLYGEREINKVEVEALNGQKICCKFRLIGDAKLDGKALVQLPQRMQLTLNTSKGDLVLVKPVIE